MHLLVPTPLVPVVSSMGGRVCNPHTTPFPLLYSSNHWEGLLITGVVCNSHAAPCLTSFTPVLGGFFSLYHLQQQGQHIIHMSPYSNFFLPHDEAVCIPHTASISLCLPPPVIGGDFQSIPGIPGRIQWNPLELQNSSQFLQIPSEFLDSSRICRRIKSITDDWQEEEREGYDDHPVLHFPPAVGVLYCMQPCGSFQG